MTNGTYHGEIEMQFSATATQEPLNNTDGHPQGYFTTYDSPTLQTVTLFGIEMEEAAFIMVFGKEVWEAFAFDGLQQVEWEDE
ncbi:MAG: hypothetical protein COA96_10225 [SAR86 cluster bacterium]|uniref:Uncharacterized protein n=1 Tax=SAR86 cluster bacterium TaxID=2030880 RepID=A0A2A5AXY5_9GAMM|nr:MAG: hypothetical protein COA96_10225 [SAR86 cluster bacterium]